MEIFKKIKYTGADNLYGDIKNGDILNASFLFSGVKDSLGTFWAIPITDIEIIEDNEEEKVNDNQSVRSLIGQNMKSLNIEF